ncbi:MAG: DUF4827 domain-containing protein [Muribaculaceae bacterium]|nr:DUF4827 domain-containing protein [Muribaculaceae bacterium]
MKKYSLIAVFVLALAAVCSCDDSKSYAELLNEEDMYVNNYLADQNVIMDIPEDSVFEYGPDAPYYRIDPDGLLYMRVISPGTEGNMVENNEQIYFRYTRYALSAYADGKLPQGQGNNISLSPYWFRYNNYSIQASVTWGVGVQRPLAFLPVDCEVDLVVKSQMGLTDEESYVQPYLFRLTYDRRQ